MQILNRLPAAPLFPRPTSVAIGNFDGVHLGHQEILHILIRKARLRDWIPMVLTFSPHTQNVVRKKQIRLIQTLDQRIAAIQAFHIHTLLILPFDRNISSLSGDEFIRDLVCAKLQAAAVIVGEDFRFGKGRGGNVSALRDMGILCDLEVNSVPAVTRNGQAVSSSLIRRLLEAGRVEAAGGLLGRHYAVTGTVIEGKSRGKTLGFPTANISTPNEILPPGVFITTVQIEGHRHQSVTNIGKCPTFNGAGTQIESHLLDWNTNIYGKRIEIRFLKKLRDEFRFPGSEELKQQLEKDLDAARRYFKRSP